jgi:hypothetical protein
MIGVGSSHVHQKGNIHYSLSNKHLSGRINPFNPSSWRVLFLNGRVVITEERTEKTVVVCEIWIDQSGKTVGVKPITIQFVELLIAWVLDHYCNRHSGALDNNTIHGVGLLPRLGDRSVFNVVKEAQ